MKIEDRLIYRECKEFYKPTGIANPTDAEVIVEMAKRFERDGNEMSELKAENAMLKMKLSVLEYNGISVKPGEDVVIESKYGTYKISVTTVTCYIDEDYHNMIRIEGVAHK